MSGLSLLHLPRHCAVFCALVALMLAPGAASGEPAPPDLSRNGAYAIGATPHRQTLAGGIGLEASPGTEVTISGKTEVPVRPHRPKTICHTITLGTGRLRVEVPAGDPPPTSILVRGSQRASFVSLGGVAEVIVTADATAVAVHTGTALVASGNDWSELAAGQVRVVRKTGPEPDHAILAAPRVKLGPELLVAPLGGTASATLEVALTPAAERYEADVVRQESGSAEVVRHLTLREARAEVPGLPPGSYSVRVFGVDGDGVASATTESSAIRVLSMEVPTGAVERADGIWLLPGQRIKLIGADGLELTYGAVNRYFVTAPRDIGLVGGRATVVRLRARGVTEETQLTLHPRANTALIELERPRVQGATAVLSVNIVILDARGAPDPRADVQKSVRVDGHEVAVRWRQQGARQVATVKVKVGEQPRKLEVRVTDGVGTLATRSTRIPGPAGAPPRPPRRSMAQR